MIAIKRWWLLQFLWNFEESLVRKYLEVMEKLNIDFVELGFRFLKDTSNLDYMQVQLKTFVIKKISKKLKLATMIFGEFNRLNLNLNKLFFFLTKKSKISSKDCYA